MEAGHIGNISILYMYICQSGSVSVSLYVRYKSPWWNAKANPAEHTTTCHSWSRNGLLASQLMSGKLILFNKIERHLGFAVKIVTICEKVVPKQFY